MGYFYPKIPFGIINTVKSMWCVLILTILFYQHRALDLILRPVYMLIS